MREGGDNEGRREGGDSERPLPIHTHPVSLPTGDINRALEARIAVYSCPFDSMGTETKGTVLLKSASELLEFSSGEEQLIEQQVKALSEAGCTVMVSGGKVGEMALHFLNKYKIMVVR